ncbi:hypothetical protein ATO12_00290 [Aquimarina atlantica]|uniref:Lipocalin-like domain-containing protein n=1 Tax=Aquimarina atlantica TaxID=1317122 RepID=A0A023BZ77_9FLAO|nr:hypothetical protein [Aquimarina atlantica]EZH75249.1 hypothetical protein ATO12_00290 [Aquimarina atlantica]
MRIITKILVTGILILAGSFNTVSEFDLENKLIGNWSYYSDNNESGVWTKVDKLDLTKSGLEFKEKGELIVRMNSGSCGTPPITYKNYNGTWKKISDSTLVLTHKFWGGVAKRSILIKTLNEKQLIFEALNDEIIRN